ncbi:hypothetical protein QTJ16_003187 [Diplocarpon rosae]|uniref:Uncharacterized protein n=1 Tax=Diplocarpon rosae TaxID=946125 RepID=A0AAD9T0X2_9HELO|nr:hypothetical protein QTJ16_003187 [Diplocarpon rosae]
MLTLTGKLGKATSDAIVEHDLIPLSEIVICTSSDITDSSWDELKAEYIDVRTFNFDMPDPKVLEGERGLIAEAKGEDVSIKVVGTEKYVDHYVKREDERSYIQSWSSNNHALEKGECLIEDSTLDELLDARSVKPTAVEETLEEILKH